MTNDYGLLGTEENLFLKGTSKHYLIFKPKAAIEFLIINKTQNRSISNKFVQDWEKWSENAIFKSNSIDLFPNELSLGLFSDVLDGQPTLFISLILLIYLQKIKGIFSKNVDLSSDNNELQSIILLLLSILFSGVYYAGRKFIDLTFTNKVKIYFKEKKIARDFSNFFTELENINHNFIPKKDDPIKEVASKISNISKQYGFPNDLNSLQSTNIFNFKNFIENLNINRENSIKLNQEAILIKLPNNINKNEINFEIPIQLTIQMKDKTSKTIEIKI